LNIIDKLRDHINAGITKEADALYLLAELRKLLEQQGVKKDYEYLTFHCDWVVHPKLSGPMAQRILKQFDEANIHLKNGLHIHELPNGLNHEIDRISKLRYFEDELSAYLKKNGLPDLFDSWLPHFHFRSDPQMGVAGLSGVQFRQTIFSPRNRLSAAKYRSHSPD
jgi:hypothetical protein